MRVAYQGAPGGFSHQAALEHCPDCTPISYPSFAAVARAVAEGEVERGVLPLENSRAGPVAGVAEIIASSGVLLLSEHSLSVRMHLLALPGVAIEEIRTVVSHPVALLQCAGNLAELGLPQQTSPNTAVAAKTLRERDHAVLASAEAAAAYGLSILREDMHDDPDNATRFAVIARP